MTDRRERDIYDALGEATLVHDLACEHEERDRHQRKAIGAIDDVLCDDLRVEDVQPVHQRDAANDQGKCNRHSERHRAEQRECEYRDGHWRARTLATGRSAQECSSLSLIVISSCSVVDPLRTRTTSYKRITAAETPNTSPDE